MYFSFSRKNVFSCQILLLLLYELLNFRLLCSLVFLSFSRGNGYLQN